LLVDFAPTNAPGPGIAIQINLRTDANNKLLGMLEICAPDLRVRPCSK
jgi:hypothetical protein